MPVKLADQHFQNAVHIPARKNLTRKPPKYYQNSTVTLNGDICVEGDEKFPVKFYGFPM